MGINDLQLEREVDILRRVMLLIEERAPKTWTFELKRWPGRRSPDVEIRTSAPDGSRVTFLVESKKTFVPSQAASAANQLKQSQASTEDKTYLMMVARYLPEGTQKWLRDAGISYADATGNIWIEIDEPALFIRDAGATSDPWRGSGRPRTSLLGEPAARVVRALADFSPPLTVPQLVKRSGASTGATYRVVDYLSEQLLITRSDRGPIDSVDWRRMLERWSVEYNFQETNQVASYLEPRGLDAVLDKLRKVSEEPYAVTGSWAAARWEPHAPVKALMIYADDGPALVERLKLRRTATGANVVIATSKYDVVYARSLTRDGVRITAATQTAVDLLTGPGRNPAEGQALLDWMERNQTEWRS